MSQVCSFSPLWRGVLKGTVPRDFLPLDFFFKQLLLAPEDKSSNDFDFFSNIRGDIRLFRCFAGVNDTGIACIAGVIDTGVPKQDS